MGCIPEIGKHRYAAGMNDLYKDANDDASIGNMLHVHYLTRTRKQTHAS